MRDVTDLVKPSPCVFPIWENDSRALLVLFSGFLAGNIPNVRYDFASFAGRFGANKLFIRDLDQAWHHFGLRQISEDIDGTAQFLKSVMEDRDIDRTVFLGVCSGAYAALLFGSMLGVDEVHAISPRTVLDRESRRRLRGDAPSDEQDEAQSDGQFEKLYSSGRAQQRYMDLSEFLRNSPNPDTIYHIYYSSRHDVDRAHAEYIGQCPGVELHPHERGDHWLVMELVAQRAFTERLKNALRESS